MWFQPVTFFCSWMNHCFWNNCLSEWWHIILKATKLRFLLYHQIHPSTNTLVILIFSISISSPYKYLAPPSQGYVSAEKWVRVPMLKSIFSLLSPCESLSKSLRQIRCSGGKTTEWRLQTFWCVTSIQLHIYAWKSLWAEQAKWFDAQVPPMPFVSFMGLLPHLLWYFHPAVSPNRGFGKNMYVLPS